MECCGPITLASLSRCWICIGRYGVSEDANAVAFGELCCSVCIQIHGKSVANTATHVDCLFVYLAKMCIVYCPYIACAGKYFLFTIIPFIIQKSWCCAHNNVQEFWHEIVVTPRNVCAVYLYNIVLYCRYGRICIVYIVFTLWCAVCGILAKTRSSVHSVWYISNSAFE